MCWLTVWKELVGVALLEGVYHWGFQKPFPVSLSLCFLLLDQDEGSQLFLRHAFTMPPWALTL